jgi:hypothetical protein
MRAIALRPLRRERNRAFDLLRQVEVVRPMPSDATLQFHIEQCRADSERYAQFDRYSKETKRCIPELSDEELDNCMDESIALTRDFALQPDRPPLSGATVEPTAYWSMLFIEEFLLRHAQGREAVDAVCSRSSHGYLAYRMSRLSNTQALRHRIVGHRKSPRIVQKPPQGKLVAHLATPSLLQRKI